jgi:hypothetical protein
MSPKPKFPRKFFDHELPKLLKLTDNRGNLPLISIALPEGKRLELTEFEVMDGGLLVKASLEEYLVSYSSIFSLHVMPRSFKNMPVAMLSCFPAT